MKRMLATAAALAFGLVAALPAPAAEVQLNSVLFPEGQERLRRFHVRELPSRPMTEAEAAAREAGLALLALYPPVPDPEAHRGDGCVSCPSYGTTCEGLEREWWTDLEWEDMWERMSSD